MKHRIMAPDAQGYARIKLRDLDEEKLIRQGVELIPGVGQAISTVIGGLFDLFGIGSERSAFAVRKILIGVVQAAYPGAVTRGTNDLPYVQTPITDARAMSLARATLDSMIAAAPYGSDAFEDLSNLRAALVVGQATEPDKYVSVLEYEYAPAEEGGDGTIVEDVAATAQAGGGLLLILAAAGLGVAMLRGKK